MEFNKTFRDSIVKDLKKIQKNADTEISAAIQMVEKEECLERPFENCEREWKFEKNLEIAIRRVEEIGKYIDAMNTVAKSNSIL